MNNTMELPVINTPRAVWDGIGTKSDGLMTAIEAIQRAHLDWECVKEPLIVRGKTVKNWFGVTRQDNDETLSCVKGRYTIIQNKDAFDFFDSVVASNKAIYDSCGWTGTRTWILAKLTDDMFIRSNPDDKIERFVLIVNSFNRSGCLTIVNIAKRFSCANALNVNLRNGKNKVKIPHTRNYNKKLTIAQKALGLVEGYFEDLGGVLDILAETPMSGGEMAKLTETLFPADKETGKLSKRTQHIREAVEGAFYSSAGNAGQTRWDALNAVTYYADHERNTRNGSNRMESAILGSGAAIKQFAFNILINNN